jgi:uncharacterized protein (DUF2062 family)
MNKKKLILLSLFVPVSVFFVIGLIVLSIQSQKIITSSLLVYVLCPLVFCAVWWISYCLILFRQAQKQKLAEFNYLIKTNELLLAIGHERIKDHSDLFGCDPGHKIHNGK